MVVAIRWYGRFARFQATDDGLHLLDEHMEYTQAKCRTLKVVIGAETAFFSPPKNKVAGLKKKVWVKESEVKGDWTGENEVKAWTGMDMLKTKEAEVRKKAGAPSRPAYSSEMLKQQALEQLGESAPTHVALFDYDPREDDDLEVREGDNITLKLDNADGWFTGFSHRTKKIGIFPADYVKALPPPPPKLREVSDGEATSVKSEKAAADARAKAQKNSIAERAKAEKAAIAERAKAEKAAIVARAKEEKAAAEAAAKEEKARAKDEKVAAKEEKREEKKSARAARTSKSSESDEGGPPKRSSPPPPQPGAAAKFPPPTRTTPAQSAKSPPPTRRTPAQSAKSPPPTRRTPAQTVKAPPPSRPTPIKTANPPRSSSVGAPNEMAAALAKVLSGAGGAGGAGGLRSPGLRSPTGGGGLRSPVSPVGPAKPPPPSAAESPPPSRSGSMESSSSGRRPPPSRAAPPMRTAPALVEDKSAAVKAPPPKKADPPAAAKAAPPPVKLVAPSVTPAALKKLPGQESGPPVGSTAAAKLPSQASTSPTNEVQKVQLRKTNSSAGNSIAGAKSLPSAASLSPECGYAMMARRASVVSIDPVEGAEAPKSVAAKKPEPTPKQAAPAAILKGKPAGPAPSANLVESVSSRMSKFSTPNESVSRFPSASGRKDLGRSLSASSDTDSAWGSGGSVTSRSSAFGVSLRKSLPDGNFVSSGSGGGGGNNSRTGHGRSASVEPTTNAINQVKQVKLKKTNSAASIVNSSSSSPATKVATHRSLSPTPSSSSAVRKSSSAGNLMSKLPKEITVTIHYRDTRRMRVSPDVLVAQLEKKIKAKFSIMDVVNLWYKKKDGNLACINSLRLEPELRKDGLKLWCLDKNIKP